MTRDEANQEAEYLHNLFPKVPVDQITVWAGIFEGYERDVVHRAVVKYYQGPGDGFIDKTELRATIENEAGTRLAGIRREIEEHDRHLAEARRARAVADESFAAVDHALDGLPDEELNALKLRVLTDCEPTLSSLLQLSDPKTGKTLRYYMAKAHAGLAMH